MKQFVKKHKVIKLGKETVEQTSGDTLKPIVTEHFEKKGKV